MTVGRFCAIVMEIFCFLQINLIHKHFSRFVSQIKVFPTKNADISVLQYLYVYYKYEIKKLLKNFQVRKPLSRSSGLYFIIGVSKASLASKNTASVILLLCVL